MSRKLSFAVWAIIVLGVAFVGIVALIAVILASRDFNGFGDHVALIRVDDVIVDSTSFIEELKFHSKNKQVKALVVRVNSPGGAVGAAQEMYREINKYRMGQYNPDHHPMPVVVSFGNVAASGGYYIACAADKIVANPGTITGSIGVIMETPEFSDLIGKVGLKFNTIKSGEFKDSGSATRPMSDKERALFQSLIDEVLKQFVSDVTEGRRTAIAGVFARQEATSATAVTSGTAEKSGKAATSRSIEQYVASLADGRIYTGKKAKELGLVDELGDLQDARKLACKLAGIPSDTEMVEKKRETSLLRSLLGSVEEAASSISGSIHAPLQFRMQ
jgi:protease IV